MAVGRISKRTVDGLAVDPARDVYLWDTEVKGFGVKLTPAGTRTYLVKYETRLDRRTRRVTIGTHGKLTAELARTEAKRLVAEVALGRDPAAEKTAAMEAGLTVSELCDLYRAEGSALKKPGTLTADASRIDCHIRPTLGAMAVTAVTRADVERLLQRIAAGDTATVDRRKGQKPNATHLVRGGKGAATRTVGLFQAILEFATKRGILASNPAKGVKRYKDRKLERYLTMAELSRLGEALADIERCGVYNAAPLMAIRLLTLTGCRRNEVLELRWEYLDAGRSCLRLPDSKTGQKVVPLGAAAVELLATLPRDPSGWIFPGEVPGEHYKNIARVWEAVRKRAELPDVRLHDLRHSFASVGVSSGDSLLIVGKILGHKHAATTQGYAHLASDPVTAAATRISGTIAAALASGPVKPSTTAPVKSSTTAPAPDPTPPPPSSTTTTRPARVPMRAERPSAASRGRRGA